MGVLLRRVLDGHERVAEWSSDDDASIDAARELLQRELDAGYIAVRAEDDNNEPLTELPVDAEAVILTMPMGGG
jgi:hypothetical protein